MDTQGEEQHPLNQIIIDTVNYDKNKIKTKRCQQDKYIVLNNDSAYITFDDANLRLYRSIVLDAETNQLVCFSPPNSIEIDTFIKKYPDLKNDEFYVNEIMEGIMINLFYDVRRETWEIATRGSVSGNYWYYKTRFVLDENDNTLKKDGLDKEYEEKTFRKMFIEALRGDDNQDINDNPIINQLPKNHTYSFVLQHPDNHIVLNICEPHLFLVGVFQTYTSEFFASVPSPTEKSIVDIIPPTEYEKWGCFSGGIIEFPITHRFTYDDIKTIDNNSNIFTKEYTIGFMITNLKTNERTTITNPAYENLKKLRGNNPNLQYHYLCLMRAGQDKKFLEFFPRYTKLFSQFQRQYHDLITHVHKSYFSYYVKKERTAIAKKYFIHASRIHYEIFLPNLYRRPCEKSEGLNSEHDVRSHKNLEKNEAAGGIVRLNSEHDVRSQKSLEFHKKVIVNRNIVKEYFDEFQPHEILYYLHYDKRQLKK